MRPREEAKKQKKEEEFYKFLGPAWKGKGQVLGVSENGNHYLVLEGQGEARKFLFCFVCFSITRM